MLARFLTTLLLIISNTSFCAVQDKKEEEHSKNQKNITHLLRYFDDPTSNIDSHQICKSHNDIFKPLIKPNFGFNFKGVRWLKIEIQRDTFQSQDLHLHHGFTRIDEFDVYYKNSNGNCEILRANDVHAQASGPAFRLPTNPNHESWTYFVRLAPNKHALNTNISISTTEGAIEYTQTHSLTSGLFFGAIIALIGCNIFLSILLKSKTHFYYVYYLSALFSTFFYLEGFAKKTINNLSDTWDQFFVSCMFLLIHGMSIFGRNILQLKYRFYLINLALKFLEFLLIASAVACFVLPIGVHSTLFHPLMLASTCVLILAVFCSFRNGSVPARIYAIAWSIFIAALIAYSLMHLNWFQRSWLLDNAVKIAAVIEATLFSFALALRIKIAEQEKNAAIDQSARRERELLESKQAELEIKVAERTASLQASLEARRMMLANVSHELRSPVNALSLLLDTPTFHRDTSAHADPTDQANPKSHQQHALTQARDISAHLARLIENLLRLEVDAQTSHPNSEVTPVADCPAQAFELGATLHAIAGMVAPLQLHGNARFDVDVSACQGRWVMGDETALRRILVNVLSNAFKFTVNGQVKLQASVTARTGDDVAGGDDTLALRFLIHDTGCGIEPTMQAQIFEPFVTTVGPRSGHTGTGLGLPLARQLARQLGGDLVLLHSTPGQGSRFECTLRLPRADAPALATSASQTPLYSTPLGRSKLTQPLVNTLASSRGLRILLAEDCPVTAHALECILRSLNHEVMHVADFQSLIAQLNPVSLSSFDLALIDHRLPGGSGLDFARRCRAMEQPAPGTAATSAASPPVRHLPIVLMTGDVTPEVILEADAVCDDLIAKPTTAQRLEQLLGRGPSALPVLDEHLPAGHRDRSSSASTLEQVIHERFADAALQSLIDPHRLLTLIRHGATHDDLLSMCHQFADSVHAALRDLAALPVDPPDAHHTHRTAPTQGQDPSLSAADAVIHRVCSGCVTMGAVSLATQFRQWPQASVDSIHASFERTQRALEDLVVRLAHHKPSAL